MQSYYINYTSIFIDSLEFDEFPITKNKQLDFKQDMEKPL